MTKFNVTTKTIFFEEHIVDAENYTEAKTKALENIEETSYVGWEGETDTMKVECIE